MAHPPHEPMQRRDRLQMWLLIVALLIVIIGAIVVVSYPRQFGLPGRHAATPAATPAAVVATPAASANP